MAFNIGEFPQFKVETKTTKMQLCSTCHTELGAKDRGILCSKCRCAAVKTRVMKHRQETKDICDKIARKEQLSIDEATYLFCLYQKAMKSKQQHARRALEYRRELERLQSQ